MKVLTVTNMYPQPDQPAFGVFVRDQVESLRRQGVEVDVLFMDGRRSKLNYLRAFPGLWARLRRERYDLLHAHYIFAGLVARAQWACPVVLTHHGPEVFMTWEANVCRLATRWFDRVIMVSPEMKERLGSEDAQVIPCGVDFDRFKPMPQESARSLLNLPPERKLILWAGEYFRPEKRFDIVERSLAILKSRDPRAELVLLSGKPHDVVPLYMNACDLLLLTSDAEGSPMVIKEAMACNLPIVSTPVGDVPSVIAGSEGCYVCSQDPTDVANKLQLALDFGRRTSGREQVRPMELSAISKRIIAVYEDALSKSRGALPSPATPVR